MAGPAGSLTKLVGERGFEPPAPASRRRCSTRLSYSPARRGYSRSPAPWQRPLPRHAMAAAPIGNPAYRPEFTLNRGCFLSGHPPWASVLSDRRQPNRFGSGPLVATNIKEIQPRAASLAGPKKNREDSGNEETSSIFIHVRRISARCQPGLGRQQVYKGIIPFVILQLVGLGLVMAFPELALWLPRLLLD